jgi:adenine phosphoribosyltransferase
MTNLKLHIRDVPDFPQPGIIFRDIAPLLREHFTATIEALSALLPPAEWAAVDAVAGIESRGFILAAALATLHSKGFVPIRKKGKLPPPVVGRAYSLEYGAGVLEIQRGEGRLVLVDDVLATGGTMGAAASLCMDAGYSVSRLIALIDLKLAADFRWQDESVLSVIQYG